MDTISQLLVFKGQWTSKAIRRCISPWCLIKALSTHFPIKIVSQYKIQPLLISQLLHFQLFTLSKNLAVPSDQRTQ